MNDDACQFCFFSSQIMTKTMIVSRSRKFIPFNPIDSGWNRAEGICCADLVLLRVTFNAKMTYDKHLHSVFSAAAQRLGIMRESWQVFHDRSVLRFFLSFVLPVLEYCSAVWCSAAESHLKLLDRVVSDADFFSWWSFLVQPRRSATSIGSSVMHAI